MERDASLYYVTFPAGRRGGGGGGGGGRRQGAGRRDGGRRVATGSRLELAAGCPECEPRR